MQAVGGTEAVRALILPNVKEYESLLREPCLDESSPKHADAEAVLTALVAALQALEDDSLGLINGYAKVPDEEQRRRLEEKVGSLIADRVYQMNRPKFVRALFEA